MHKDIIMDKYTDYEIAQAERFYHDLEHGFAQCGKPYTRPSDWLERFHKKSQRKPMRYQVEGKAFSHGVETSADGKQ